MISVMTATMSRKKKKWNNRHEEVVVVAVLEAKVDQEAEVEVRARTDNRVTMKTDE